MQRGENHSGDDKGDRYDFQELKRPLHLEALQYDGRELERKHAAVERDTPTHFEHDRMGVPHDERMPDAVGASKVEHEREHHQHITEEGGEDGWTHNGFVSLDIEDV